MLKEALGQMYHIYLARTGGQVRLMKKIKKRQARSDKMKSVHWISWRARPIGIWTLLLFRSQ